MKRIIAILFLIAGLAIATPAAAQCPMCKATVESAMKEEGNTKALGINDAILYLLAAPYIGAIAVGAYWYRNYRRANA